MAYPLTSELGNLTCTAASGDLLYHLGTAIRIASDVATLNIESNEYDATTPTGSAVNMMTMNAGLRQGTVAYTGIYPRAANPLGLSALITYASGYVQYVNAFTINLTWPAIDITSATGAAGSYRRWMPGGTGRWSGSYTCKADNATALVMPTVGVASAATFKLAEDGVADPTLSGSITTPRLTQTVRIGAESVATYSFSGSGDLTQAAGTALPGIFAASGVISKPTWDLNNDGTPDNTCLLTVASGRTYTFPAFWTNVSLTWQMDQPVRVAGTLQIAGDVTVA
jgi:hypothetical protein